MLELKPLHANITQEPQVDLSGLANPRTSQQRLTDALNQPPISKLLGEIWMSGELHLLFADTGVGKSIFAVTIGNALSKGENVIYLRNELSPLNVLYYDFELSDRQFLHRYSNEKGGCYGFSSHFFIDTIDFVELYKVANGLSVEKTLLLKIREDIKRLGVDVLIVDNITYLKTQTTQTTESALEVMRDLTNIKRDFNISILVLAHTPKIDLSSPLTINSLAGSKHLSNFADSVSAIGRSVQGANIRYIKQIKPSRSAEMVYDSNNVITCQLVKKESFLTFDFLGYNEEYEHLRRRNFGEDRDGLITEACKQISDGKTYAQVADALLGDPKKKGTVFKWVNSKGVSQVSKVSNSNNGNDRNDGNDDRLSF